MRDRCCDTPRTLLHCHAFGAAEADWQARAVQERLTAERPDWDATQQGARRLEACMFGVFLVTAEVHAGYHVGFATPKAFNQQR